MASHDDFYSLAVKAHKSGRIKDAVSYYRQALVIKPNDPKANFNLGALYELLGENTKSAKCFKLAVEHKPFDEQVYFGYAKLLLRLSKFDDLKDLLRAARNNCIYTSILSEFEKQNIKKIYSSPKSPEDILLKANSFKWAGNYKEAIDYLKTLNNMSVELESLLIECNILANKFDEARALIDKIETNNFPTVEIELLEIKLLYQQNQVLKAHTKSEELSIKNPSHLGGTLIHALCLRRINKASDALRILNRIIELHPNSAEAHINRAFIHYERSDAAHAFRDLQRAYTINPNLRQMWQLYVELILKYQEDHFAAASILTKILEGEPNSCEYLDLALHVSDKITDPDAKLAVLKRLTYLRPNHLQCYFRLAHHYEHLNSHVKAVTVYKKILTLNENDVLALKHLANVQIKLGMCAEALESAHQLLKIYPADETSHLLLGNIYLNVERYEDAARAFSDAIYIRTDYKAALFNFGIALKYCNFIKFNKRIYKTTLLLLSIGNLVNPYQVVKPILSLLRSNKKFMILEDNFWSLSFRKKVEIVKRLAAEELFLKLMCMTPISDLQIENALSEIRAFLLFNINEIEPSSDILRFQSALAQQCFINEYIYNTSAEEKLALEKLIASFANGLSRQKSDTFLLTLASYESLDVIPNIADLKKSIHTAPVIEMLIVNPEVERQLRRTVKYSSRVENQISQKVRAQYESSPYPRWVDMSVMPNPLSLQDYISRKNLKVRDFNIGRNGPDILIAGCGTGRQAIDTATSIRDCNVTAVDISISSICYAKRKSLELGLSNINFVHCDILNISSLGKTFDIIESVGVLHHMQDPLVGWKSLKSCLRANGLMRIGLYSEVARKKITNTINQIKNLELNSSQTSIREFRKFLIDSRSPTLNELQLVSDFYSLSELRDLLFHEHECHFNLMRIDDYLKKLNLNFSGFESATLQAKFLRKFPKSALFDLTYWDLFEGGHTNAFLGMYQFWCQDS